MAPRVVIAWMLVAAQLAIFGTAAFTLTLGGDSLACRGRLAGNLMPLWRELALANLVLSPLLFVAIVAGMGGFSWSAALPYLPQVLRETYAGRVWQWRFAAVAAMAIAAWVPAPRILTATALCTVSAVLILLGSLTSHAVGVSGIDVTVDFTHQAAAALWFGAIAGLWFGARRANLGDAWTRQTAPWVSRIAGWTVGILILSGLYVAYRAVGHHPVRLMHSAYGRTLAVKIVAASIVLLIGAYNRFLVMPRLGSSSARNAIVRNVGIESMLLIGVMGLAALLANTPPAHH